MEKGSRGASLQLRLRVYSYVREFAQPRTRVDGYVRESTATPPSLRLCLQVYS